MCAGGLEFERQSRHAQFWLPSLWGRLNEEQLVCSGCRVTDTEICGVRAYGQEIVTCG